MLQIIDLTDEQLAHLRLRTWLPFTFKSCEECERFYNCPKFLLVRNQGKIIGYSYIDFKKKDEEIAVWYLSICELREYGEEEVSYHVNGDSTNDDLIITSRDKERIEEELAAFENREDPDIWWMSKYMRNKDRVKVKVEDKLITMPGSDDTEFTSLMMLTHLLEKKEQGEGYIIYERRF